MKTEDLDFIISTIKFCQDNLNCESDYLETFHNNTMNSLSLLEDEKNNNNGWTKIQSEEDLPELGGNYHVFMDNKITTATYVKNNRWFTSYNDYPKTTESHNITHYQKILTPINPQY